MSQQQHIVYISGVLNGVTQTGWHGPFPTEHMAHKFARQKREEKGSRTVYTRIEPLGAVNIESLVEYQEPPARHRREPGAPWMGRGGWRRGAR
jgi:hypothetical protein